MDLSSVLWIYIILIFVIFVVLYKNTFHFIEAFVISLVIGLFFIVIVYPPQELDMENENLSCSALYIFIIVITFLIILIYAIYSAWKVRKSQDKICVPKYK
jgi:membrane-bound ClpP family serine protease